MYKRQLLYSPLRLIPISFEMSSILSSGLPAFSTTNLKIRIIHAQSKFSSAGVPRLGFPDFWTDDGPHGVRCLLYTSIIYIVRAEGEALIVALSVVTAYDTLLLIIAHREIVVDFF